jgi:hypothetical protein
VATLSPHPEYTLRGLEVFVRYIGALLMAFGLLLGVVFLYAAGRESVLQLQRSSYLKRTEGEIIKIEIDERTGRDGKRLKTKRYYIAILTVSFQTETGKSVVFQDQVASRTSKDSGYQIGEKIGVIYDPENKLLPRIEPAHTELGILIAAIFGFVMAGGSLIFFKFFWWDKLRFNRAKNSVSPLP